MSTWEPLDSPYPDTWEEDYEIAFPSGKWEFRRIGKNSWLRAEQLDHDLELRGLSKFSLLFDERDLASEGTELLAAKPPSLYIAVGEGTLGVENVTCGTFDVTWYDLEAGRMRSEGERDLDGGDETFDPPDDATGRVALFLRRTSR